MTIIRQALRAVRVQDWSTLTIELLVLVVGIFLGLQVNDWNEARKDAAREDAYLERLLEDIDEMISRHEAYEARANSKLDALMITFDALRSCALPPETVAPFEETLLEHQGLPRLAVVRSTFDEMVAVGALAGLGDRRLKTKISEIYSEAVAGQQLIEYFTADLGRASDIIWRHVSFDLKAGPTYPPDASASWTPETYSLSVTYNFDALCNAAEFKNALVEVFDSTRDRLGVGTAFADDLRSLRGLLGETLGKN